MRSFSGIAFGLSLVFSLVLLGLIAELYYLLWWKRRKSSTETEDYHHTSYIKEIPYLSCWKKPNSVVNTMTNNSVVVVDEPDVELGPGNDSVRKGAGEEGADSEIMRLHNLCGPPRFLFTIKEESKEDLESDDGRSSLDGPIVAVDHPSLLSPLSSPPPPPPLKDAELRSSSSSPPPKFKFLRDAEEKLMRRLVEEARRRRDHHGCGGKDCHQWHPSGGSQVLPLASSPSGLIRTV